MTVVSAIPRACVKTVAPVKPFARHSYGMGAA
jgi:hypothetical protein